MKNNNQLYAIAYNLPYDGKLERFFLLKSKSLPKPYLMLEKQIKTNLDTSFVLSKFSDSLLNAENYSQLPKSIQEEVMKYKAKYPTAFVGTQYTVKVNSSNFPFILNPNTVKYSQKKVVYLSVKSKRENPSKLNNKPKAGRNKRNWVSF